MNFKLISFMICILFLSSCNISKYFQQKYYKDSYGPIEIQATIIEAPDHHFIEGITCYSYEGPYCQSASLQMVNSLSNDSLSIHHYNWLMGFTYGAYFHDYVGVYSFLPSTDPEIGLIQAENYIGYRRKYYTTNNENLYISSLKDWLSKNVPLRVAINSATLVDEEGFYAHSVLLVGYSDENVIYYETGGENRNLKNHEGERATWQKFIKSVLSVSEGFNYPWKYQFTVLNQAEFEGSLKDYTDDTLLKNNAYSLIGDKYGPVSIGAKAYESLASYIKEKGLDENEASYLKETLMMGKDNRYDNAVFLKGSKNKKLLELSNHLSKSSKLFAEALSELEKREYENLRKVLLSLYENEKLAGQLILNEN